MRGISEERLQQMASIAEWITNGAVAIERVPFEIAKAGIIEYSNHESRN